MEVVQFLGENKVVILAFLLSLSELLALSPKIKSNSIFQLLVNFVKNFSPKAEKK